jgi:hypothetical protein
VTAPSTAPPSGGSDPASIPAAPQRPEFDEGTVRLTMLIDGLDRVGLTGVLGEACALLHRAGEVQAAADDGHRRAHRLRTAVVARVVDGTATLDEVAAELAAVAGWLPDPDSSPAAAITRRVVAELRAAAVGSARAEALAVHSELSRLADAAVRRGVEAGRKLVDVRAVAAALTPPAGWPPPPSATRSDPRQHPWLTAPPVLPVVDAAGLAADPATAPHWAEASQAHAEWIRLLDVARLLREAYRVGYRPFGVDADPNVSYFVEQLPQQVHLAVADALDWRPGLHVVLKPSAPRGPADERRPWWQPRALRTMHSASWGGNQ